MKRVCQSRYGRERAILKPFELRYVCDGVFPDDFRWPSRIAIRLISGAPRGAFPSPTLRTQPSEIAYYLLPSRTA
jgi:hypothetical protein